MISITSNGYGKRVPWSNAVPNSFLEDGKRFLDQVQYLGDVLLAKDANHGASQGNSDNQAVVRYWGWWRATRGLLEGQGDEEDDK